MHADMQLKQQQKNRKYSILARNATLQVGYFWMHEFLNICICIYKQTDIFDFYLSVTYFQFQFPLLSAFIACLTECEVLTSDSFIWNLSRSNFYPHDVVSAVYAMATWLAGCHMSVMYQNG